MTRAISLWQPWASLWCSPRKIHETRHWPTSHRGWLLVHAAQRFEKDHGPDFANILRAEFGSNWFRDLPRGALIGMVNLVACQRTEDIYPRGVDSGDDFQCGNFDEGRYGWRRDEFKRFANPIPYRGQQGMFEVPDAVLQAGAAERPPTSTSEG